MTDNFDIPSDLKGTYNRVIHQAPEKLRPDSHFQQLTLLHLKVGGERLAKHNTELFKLVLEEDRIFNFGRKSEENSGENDRSENELKDGDALAAPEEDEEDEEEEADEVGNPREGNSSNSGASATPELQAGPDTDHILLTMECWGDGEMF